VLTSRFQAELARGNIVRSCQRVEQRLGVLQIGGVEASVNES
jgi:hypothetical protein